MPRGEEHVSALVVKVAGQELPDDVAALMVEGLVDDSLELPAFFALRFTDEEGTVLAKGKFRLGAEVVLSVQSSGGQPVELVRGEVTAVEAELRESGLQTVVRGLDVSHRLLHGSRVAAYQEMTASEIVGQVAQRAGLTAQVEATRPVLPHVTQDGVSDWDFVRRLARESHRVLTVRAGRLEMTARPDSAAAPSGKEAAQDPHVLQHGVNLVSLRATLTSAGQVPEVEVRGWDPARKQAVVGTHAASTRAATLDGVRPDQVGHDVKSPALLLALPSVVGQDQVDATAEALADHVAGGFVELEGTVRGNPALRAGTPVELTGVGAPFAGKYLLSSTRHEFTGHSGHLTAFRVGNTSERSLFGAVSAGRPGSRGHAAGVGVGAVYPALVTNAKDPDSLGRVRVQLPWLDETYESAWARTVFPGASGGRGMVSLPEVGDEVLVAFGDDRMGQPYVLGGLTNAKDGSRAHVGGNGEVTHREWVSRTGMSVSMQEEQSGQKLVVSTNEGKQRITLLQSDKGIEIVSEGKVEVVTTSGDITLKGMKVQVEAQGDLVLKAGGSATVEATGPLGLKSTASATLEGSASTKVTSSGVLTVQGSLVKIN